MLGDYYRAEPPIRCPVCAEPVFEWEGFAGSGRWLVWTEGVAEPETDRVPPSLRQDEETLRALRLTDGEHSLYASCVGGHHLIAHIEVRQGLWSGTRIADAEGHGGVEITAPWRLWWTLGRLVSIATDRPEDERHVVPATITAVGANDQCILATRRAPRRDASPADDEWWVVDLGRGEAHGPVPDAELRERLAELGLEEPEQMTLPEDLGRG